MVITLSPIVKPAFCLARDAVAHSRHDRVEDSRHRTEEWNRKHIAFGHGEFAVATHRPRVIAATAEAVTTGEAPLRVVVVEVEFREACEVHIFHLHIGAMAGPVSIQRDVRVALHPTAEERRAQIGDAQAVARE